MRTVLASFVVIVMMLLAASPARAQVKEQNDWIIEQVTSLGAGPYVLAGVVVILAAILMAAGLLRRNRR